MQIKSFSRSWTKTDELHIKVKDMSGRTVYKLIANINDTKKVYEVLCFLEKYGFNIMELYEEIKKRKDNPQPLGYNEDDYKPFSI